MTTEIRAAREDDMPGLIELLRACEVVDLGAPETTEDDIRWPWRNPEFELDKDTFVIERDGSIVAYGSVFEGGAEGWVHPAYRGHGVGARLLEAIERRALVQGSPDGKLRQNVTSLDRAGLDLLQRRGYSESHHYARMEIALERPPEVPHPPDDVEVGNLEPGMERAVYETYVAAWAQYAPSWRDEGFERWSLVFEEGDFERGLWFVARRAGKVVAYNQNLASPQLGWIQMLGTVPEERGSGLGHLLLMNALAAFYSRGLRRVALTVSSRNVPQARRLYERAGFSETVRYINLVKDLPGE